MARESCHEEAFLPPEAPLGIHQGDILLGIRPFVCAGERKVVIAVFCPRRSTASVPWGSGRCGAAEFRVLDVVVDANGGGAGGAWAGAGTGAGAGADAVAAPALQGFGGRLRLSRAAWR